MALLIYRSRSCVLAFLSFQFLIAFSGLAQQNMEKQFQDAVEDEDYDRVFQLGRPLVRQLTLQNKPEAASAVYREMASSSFFRGEFSKAIQLSSSGIALLKNSTPAPLAFKHASTLAKCYANQSLIDSAKYWFVRSEEILNKFPELHYEVAPFVAVFYNNLGAFHLVQRDTHQALLYYNKALNLALKGEDKRAIGIAYNSVANYYNQVAFYEQAKASYLKAAAFFDPESIDHCWIQLSLSYNESKLKRYAQSLRYIRRSIQLYRQLIQNRPELKQVYLEKQQLIQLGECHLRLGQLSESRQAYSRCLQMLATDQNFRSEESAYCYLGLGEISQTGDDYKTALLYYQKALIASSISFQGNSIWRNPSQKDVLSSRVQMDILSKKAACLDKIGGEAHKKMALNTYIRAIDEAEKLRKNMSMEMSKLFFSEKVRPVFNAAIGISYGMVRNHPNSKIGKEQTIALIERSRRVVLSDILHERHIKPRNIPSGMLKTEARLQQEISRTRIGYMNAVELSRQDSLRVSLQNKEIARQKLLRQMEVYYPGYEVRRHEGSHIDLSKIKQGMNARTACVGYYLAQSSYFVYVITSTDSWVRQLSIPSDLFGQIDDLQKELTTDPLLYSFEAHEATERLYQYLIAPVYDKLQNYTQWCVIRDGKLNLVPFEILKSKRESATLITKHAISYHQSAELLIPESDQRGRLTNMVGFAPFDKPAVRDSTHWLPHTEREIRKTSSLFFLGPEATKQQFLRTIHQADALHLATHGQYNDSIPENSYITFSSVNADYKLFAHEIANLPLEKVRLAILSFCDADRGKMHNSEGALSLARAFRLAGCPGMLVTLWKADDEITSYIVQTFYAHLRVGKSPDVALQQAKTDYFLSEIGKANNHPYYWANLVYIGDRHPLYSPILPLVKKATGFGIFLLLSGLAVFYYIRRKNKMRAAV